MSVTNLIKSLQIKSNSVGNSIKVCFDNLFSSIKRTTESYYEAIVDPDNHLNDGKLITSFIRNNKIITIGSNIVNQFIKGNIDEEDYVQAKGVNLSTQQVTDDGVSYNELEEAISQKLGCGQLFSIFGETLRNQWNVQEFKPTDVLNEVVRRCEQNGIPTDINSYNGELFSLLSNTINLSSSYNDAMFKVVSLLSEGATDDMSSVASSPVLTYSHCHPFLTYVPEFNISLDNLWSSYTACWTWYFKFSYAFWETAVRLVKVGLNKLHAAILNGLYPIDIKVEPTADDCSITNGFHKITNQAMSQLIDDAFLSFRDAVQSRLADDHTAKLRIDTPFGKFFIDYQGTIYMKPYVSNKDMYIHINNQINTDPSVNGFCSDIIDFIYCYYQNGLNGLQWLYNNSSYNSGSTTVGKGTEWELLWSFCESGSLMCEWIIWLFGWNPNVQPLAWFNDWRTYVRGKFSQHMPNSNVNPTNGDWYDCANIEIDLSDYSTSNVEMGWKVFYTLLTDLVDDPDCAFINTSDIKCGVTIIDDTTWQTTINRILIVTAIVVVSILVFKGVGAAKNKAISKIAEYNALSYDPNATAGQIKAARRQAKFWNALSLGSANNVMNYEALSPITSSTLVYLIKGSL